MASFAQLAKKLQSAINQRAGAKIIVNTQQWYSEDKGRTVTAYVVKQSTTVDRDKPYRHNVELYKTYSTVRLVLWLRDYWYTLNGWEIPTDNEMWEEIKRNESQNGDSR